VSAEQVFTSRRESAFPTFTVEPEIRSDAAKIRDLRRLCVRSDDAVRQLRGTQRCCPPPAAASAVLVEHLCPSPSASLSRDNKRNKFRASDASEFDSARSHDPDNHAEPNRLTAPRKGTARATGAQYGLGLVPEPLHRAGIPGHRRVFESMTSEAV
jgi:hypothetical protein